MSAPYACWRSAICPGLDCVVMGGGGVGAGLLASERRRRTSSPSPPASAALAAATVARESRWREVMWPHLRAAPRRSLAPVAARWSWTRVLEEPERVGVVADEQALGLRV